MSAIAPTMVTQMTHPGQRAIVAASRMPRPCVMKRLSTASIVTFQPVSAAGTLVLVPARTESPST